MDCACVQCEMPGLWSEKKIQQLKGMVYLSGQWDLTAIYCKECVASATTFVKFQLLFADWLHTRQAVKDTSATFSSLESR